MRYILLVAMNFVAGCGGQQPESTARLVGRPAYADSGACPFECCRYGRWRADSLVVLRVAPDSGSQPVARLSAGDSADAITGFVRTVPAPLVVKQRARQTSNGDYLYQPGETLWVYTYLGEGTYRARRDTGAFFDDMFEPGAVEGVRETDVACKTDSLCWAVFTPPKSSVWWVRMRTRDSTIGWTAEADRFHGKDACSID